MTAFSAISAHRSTWRPLLVAALLTLAGLNLRAEGVAGGRIYTRAGELFQVFLDGAPLGRPANSVTLPTVAGGYHWLEFRFPGRRMGSVTGFRVQAWFAPDFESVYELDAFPRNGRMTLTRVSYAVLGDYQQPPSAYYQPAPGGYADPNAPQCANLLYPRDVDALLSQLRSRDFENTRLAEAKQATANATVLAEDVARILRTFEFENSRLDFAKYAYSRCCDSRNYFKVNAAFEFESSVTEMQRFTQGR